MQYVELPVNTESVNVLLDEMIDTELDVIIMVYYKPGAAIAVYDCSMTDH